MANHSYVTMTQAISAEQADSLIRETLQEGFGDLFQVVDRLDLEVPWRATRVWFIALPNSAPEQDATQPEDYGFLVFLQDNAETWEFRHPLNKWERWAQARFYSLLAHKMGLEIRDDAATKSFPPHSEYLNHSTFFDYITRHLPKPLDTGNTAWGQRMLNDFAPPQLRKIP